MSPSLAALIIWIVCLPVAFGLASLGPANPFLLRVAMVPVVVAIGGVIVVGIASRRLPADLASGIGAGLFGGWVAFTLRVALHGTPFGFDGLAGDAGRMADMANRYASTWRSSDGIVSTVPSHYPPLFPWLVGRTSALINVPAWKLLGPAEAITLSFVVVAGYILWRKVLPGPLALAVTLPVLLCFSLPEKAYEILALAVFVPWAIATFGDPPRGRLHWLPAGLIGGLSIVLSWAFIIYGALGIVALAVLTWRASQDRARYVRHVVLTVIVSLVVASWYLVPYLGWGFLHGSKQVDDLFQGGGIQDSPLLFLTPSLLGVLELIGVIGLLWYRGRVSWGMPLLLLTVGAYAYWLLGLASFSLTGHTLLLQDTPRLIGPMLAAAGVLTIVHTAPIVARRFSVRSVPAGLPALALCLLVVWTAITAWQGWMPGGPTPGGGLYQPAVSTAWNESTAAFATPLPDGSYVPVAAERGIHDAWFPTDPVKNDVTSVLGASATPVTLSTAEELFTYVNWPGYIGVSMGAAGTNTDWPARYAALQKLSRITDPAAFTAASARTAFGPVDVFILQRSSPTRWTWQPIDAPYPVLTFTPAQFSPHAFTVFTNLPGNLVVAVRQPQGNG
ncbi:MAG: arabinofuranosyltransferase [Trebonia sp.]|uniref:arabinofuranosyltransferase n=4 Tax=Trebonia sp. TaxID=2767075 RepID=UPI003BAE622A